MAVVIGPGSMLVELRPETAEDDDTSLAILGSTRARELAMLPWGDGPKMQWLVGQHQAQQHAYRSAYPEGRFDLVVVDGEVVGRLYIGGDRATLYVIDIALMPEWRNRGIGTALLVALLEEAATSGWSVHLHVEVGNPAARLYRRLGFSQVDDDGMHCAMVANPQPTGRAMTATSSTGLI
jgi:ribosomal protein S18 acetylase RimI-like enzyme